MDSTSITLRMDKDLKRQAELLFEDMGMNMTTAFTVFAKAVVREGKIPFEIKGDLFYNKEHRAYLDEAIDAMNTGKRIVSKTMAELEAMERE
ncbi:DNA-damage-inducible protein J [Spirochaetia bacterium]|nr:DNA-damage-inducible protein J [Spirochaetia bacterium]